MASVSSACWCNLTIIHLISLCTWQGAKFCRSEQNIYFSIATDPAMMLAIIIQRGRGARRANLLSGTSLSFIKSDKNNGAETTLLSESKVQSHKRQTF